MNKLSIIIFTISLSALSILSLTFIDANFIYMRGLFNIFHTGDRLLQTVIYFSIISLLFIIYALFLKRPKSSYIRIGIVLSGLALFFSYPTMLSYDIFNYIATAKVTFFYQENPYVVMPIQFLGDPMLLFTQAANKTALYGPFWILITGIPFVLSQGSYLLSIFFFKLLSICFYIGLTYLIYKITKDKFNVVFFALNPLVLIETFLSGHNDVVMMFLALFAFYLLGKRKAWLAILFIFLSVLIKFASIVLLPIFAYCLIMQANKWEINWDKIWFLSFLFMFVIFSLSFLREEIYPWYSIWPMTFLALLTKRNNYIIVFVALTYGLMLRYMPYMFLGTHFGVSPILKLLFMILPPLIALFYLIFSKKIKLKF